MGGSYDCNPKIDLEIFLLSQLEVQIEKFSKDMISCEGCNALS